MVVLQRGDGSETTLHVEGVAGQQGVPAVLGAPGLQAGLSLSFESETVARLNVPESTRDVIQTHGI